MTERMAYVGTLPCGCIDYVGIDSDEFPQQREHLAAEIAELIRDGVSISRRAVEDVRADPAFLRDCGGPAHVRTDPDLDLEATA